MVSRKTHLMNEHGDKKVIETKNAEKQQEQLNEKNNSNYFLDIDWYLNNGYSIAEDVFGRIESHAGVK